MGEILDAQRIYFYRLHPKNNYYYIWEGNMQVPSVSQNKLLWDMAYSLYLIKKTHPYISIESLVLMWIT